MSYLKLEFKFEITISNFKLLPETMIPATGNNRNFSRTDRKDTEIPTEPTGYCRKIIKHGSSFPTGNFSIFFPRLPVISWRFHPKTTGTEPEINENNPKHFLLENCIGGLTIRPLCHLSNTCFYLFCILSKNKIEHLIDF